MSAPFELNHRIHVLTRKEELDAERARSKVIVVLDILFATTTIVAALAEGAAEVLPVANEAAARVAGAGLEPGSYVLSGELYADTLPGFAPPAPLALLQHGVRGKTLVYSTTNGTLAVLESAGARRVYCGSLLNANAVAKHIAAEHAGDTVLVLCAGSGGNFNLEDFFGAGCLVDRLTTALGADADLSDSARAALALYRGMRASQALMECRVGRMMARRGLAHEVDFACRLDAYPIVPRLDGGRLRVA